MNLHCLSFFQSQKIKIMSDSCHFHGSFMAVSWHFHIHVGFMARSWHFHGAFFLLIFIVFPNSFMALACQIHRGFIADSSQIHRGFMPVSFNPKRSKSCHFHGSFMAVSWHFHIQVLPGYSLPNLLEKLSKKSVLVVDLFFLPIFSFIFGNMSDSCRFHGPFMALASFWFFSWKKSKPTTESISKMTV